MFSEESSSDFAAFESDFQTSGAIISSKLTSKAFEQKQRLKSESQTSAETTKSYNFRLSRSKYANLIDQSDIKWWTDIQAKRLAAGKDDLNQSATAESIEAQANEKAAISHLSNAPICCPIMDCGIIFLPNDMMLHFLSYHKRPAPIRRVFEKQRLLITLKPFELNVDEVSCLGLVSFAGKKLEKESNLWISQNVKLCKDFSPLMYDYPIFVLASIVPMDVYIQAKTGSDEFCCTSIGASTFVLWLAGAENNANIFYTITAFSEQLTNSQSGIYNIRTLTESQCPSEFCNKDCNYFHLSFKELYSLLRDEKTLEIEFVFQESLEQVEK